MDVLGHGREAHELAVNIEKFLIAQCSGSVVHVMDRLHKHLIGTRGAGAGLCFVDRRTGLLRFTGTGNTVIRRFGSGEVRLLSRPGIIGGNRRTPKEERMTLIPGDVVLLYTDGVTDATNAAGQMYELEKLVGTLGNVYNEPASGILRIILNKIKNFQGEALQTDDITMVVIKSL